MNFKKYKLGAVVLSMILLGSMIIIPSTGAFNVKTKKSQETLTLNKILSPDPIIDPDYNFDTAGTSEKVWLYTNHYRSEDVSLAGEQNDIGYNIDAGNSIVRSIPLYVGEPVDQTVPGRGRTAELDTGDGDSDDWYRFTVCEGQQMSATVGGGFDYEFCDTTGSSVGTTYTADVTGRYFLHVYTSSGSGSYTFTVTLSGQNDASTGNDAGDGISQATSISPGDYYGYMDHNDPADWYSFSASSGQGITINVEPTELKEGDFDIHLYNPSGEWVYSANYYGKDTLEYPADASGTWKFKIDMFPGWDQTKWPDNYFLYGSGAYELSLDVGGSVESPPGPIPQPDIRPVSQTFEIQNKPGSNEDEYAFLAAVPSAVYKQGGKQYVSPVVYVGDSTPTSWYGNADQTTQYLIDDWEAYLARHDSPPRVYTIDKPPVQAAAELAMTNWVTSDSAVLAVDGSGFIDVVETNIDEDATLNVQANTFSAAPGDSNFRDFAGHNSIQMWIGKEWGSMTIYAHGNDCPDVGLITPRFELGTAEDWPHPYDTPGDNTNIYFPVAIAGPYWPYITGTSGFDTFEITKYTGDRYTLQVTNSDSTIEVDVDTSSSEYLEVFLVDPQGNVRRPSVPSWNGGPIKPIHQWNGDHHNGFEDWRRWEPTGGSKSIELHYPDTGKWTIIVTPHYPYGQEQITDTINYHITANIREHNQQRIDAGLSAANAAVIASQIHAPLLYVTEDSVPAETTEALNQLGVKDITFVNINEVSKALPKTYAKTTMPQTHVKTITSLEDVIQTTNAVTTNLKSPNADGNVITITSFGSEDGYFAPAGLIAAYHGSNVINIGEAPDAYNFLDKATAWREYGGGWYHGMRGQGHLYKMNEPINVIQIIKNLLNGQFPELGLDQHLRWWEAVNDGIYNWVDSLGLTGSGQEVYMIVSPRDTDIRHPIIRVLSGAGAYAGQFPFDTPGLDAALISRDILYPAIIYANPGRDVTTAQLMNFPDGWQWKTNDGTQNTVYSTREVKEAFSSHGRFFEGHVIWEGWLERINEGAAINYYSGHGTGGSGISEQFSNVAESFPYADLRHESLHDFDWWDGWRGYMYDDEQTKTPRWGGFTWYNAAEPNLYDIIHFKWVDQKLQNLHSEIELWMSCTTGQHFGPEIYLEHGSALWYGNAGTGLCPQEDLLDDQWIHDMMINGLSVGEAFSKYVWLHQRDFSAKQADQSKYNAALYGTSSLEITNVQVLFGDPTLTCYSPEWVEPIPI